MSRKKEKLKQVEKEVKELERKKAHIKNMMDKKRKNEERRKRANRLIRKGALAEQYFDIYNLTPEETEELFKMFSAFIKANKPNHLKK